MPAKGLSDDGFEIKEESENSLKAGFLEPGRFGVARCYRFAGFELRVAD
jgi:hypothetical protein